MEHFMVAYYCSERVLCHPQNGGKFKFCLACLTNFRERFLPGQPVGDTEVSAWIAWSDSKFENSSSVRWLIIENIVCTPSGGPILPFMQISSHFEHCKYVFWIRTGFEAWWDPRARGESWRKLGGVFGRQTIFSSLKISEPPLFSVFHNMAPWPLN